MRLEVRVSSPEPAVGVFTAAIGFGGGGLERTGRGHGAGETSEMGTRTSG